MNQIEKRLKERGHSNPEIGLTKVKVTQLAWGDEFRHMSPEEFIERIKSGDQGLRNWVESELDNELQEVESEARHYSGVPGGWSIRTTDWNNLRIDNLLVVITGKGDGWQRDDDYEEFEFSWVGHWDPRGGHFFEFDYET